MTATEMSATLGVMGDKFSSDVFPTKIRCPKNGQSCLENDGNASRSMELRKKKITNQGCDEK